MIYDAENEWARNYAPPKYVRPIVSFGYFSDGNDRDKSGSGAVEIAER
jgi:hypothetical protein